MPRTTTTPPASTDGAPGQGRGASAARPTAKSTATSGKAQGTAAKAPAKARAAKAAPAAPTDAEATGKPAKVAAKSPAKAPAKTARQAAAAPEAPAAGGAGGYGGDAAFLDQQRQALLEERATYMEQARSLRAEAESLVQEMEPGDVQFDDESGEGGTTTVDRERDLALSNQALAAVEEIDAALDKIEHGRYGICEGCGQLIPQPRLEALPYARLCIACKSGGLSRR